MSYLIKLVKSLKTIIITYLLQYIVIIIVSIIYLLLGHKDTTTFLTTYIPPILIIFNILIIVYFLKKYHRQEPSLSQKNYFPLISLGISLSCFLNMLIFTISPPTTTTTLPFIILLISSSLVGPIFEELLFRYIFLNKLKEFNSPPKAIIINSLIFALLHFNPIEIVYAFILGLILNLSYHHTKNILSPILIHISANFISLFLTEFNPTILFLSIINIILTIIIIKTPNKSN